MTHSIENTAREANTSLAVNYGEQFEAVLVHINNALWTEQLVNGLPCIIHFVDDPLMAGDLWRLRLGRDEPENGIHRAYVQGLVKASDGIDELCDVSETWVFREVRQAHRLLKEIEQQIAPDSLELAEALMTVAAKTNLPAEYRYPIALRVLDIYLRELEKTDQRWLALNSVIAYTIPKGEARENAFLILVERQNSAGDTKVTKASALGNLGNICLEEKRWQEAVNYFRAARQISDGAYFKVQLSKCLAALGEFEQAYELIKEFPELHFQEMADVPSYNADAVVSELGAIDEDYTSAEDDGD